MGEDVYKMSTLVALSDPNKTEQGRRCKIISHRLLMSLEAVEIYLYLTLSTLESAFDLDLTPSFTSLKSASVSKRILTPTCRMSSSDLAALFCEQGVVICDRNLQSKCPFQTFIEGAAHRPWRRRRALPPVVAITVTVSIYVTGTFGTIPLY